MKRDVQAIKQANFVYIVGNGGSASTASHFAQDLVKACGIKAICLSDNSALITAIANDEGYEHIYVDQLEVFLQENDLLITISGSGESFNILEAIHYAETRCAILQFPTMRDYGLDMQKTEDKHLELAHRLVKELLE